jgi:GFO/IDH/MocA oxidoreductase family protein
VATAVTGETVRLGVVGCGLIAQLVHLPALASLSGLYAIVAVADPSTRARSAVAQRYGVEHTYARHEELLAHAGVDAVLVASPNGTHAGVTLDALAAGVHVLVEKPLCLTPEDAGRIVELAASTGLVVQVGYMKQFDAAYEALRERLPAPGDLRLIASTTVDPGIGERYRPLGFVAATDVAPSDRGALARTTREQVAAAIGSDDPRHVRPFSDAFLGALVHDVNLVLGLLDDVELEVVDAAGAPDGSLAFGIVTVGRTARWTATWMLLPGAGPFREELRLFAADGVRTLTFAAPYDPAPAWLDSRCFGPGADSYARQLVHFHDCVTNGATCRTPATQGARDVTLLTELYQAAIAA